VSAAKTTSKTKTKSQAGEKTAATKKETVAVNIATATKPAENAFIGAADALGAGIDALFAGTGDFNDFEIMVNLDDIEIRKQEREVFEGADDQTLADLGRSLRKHQIQAILLRPNEAGKEKPYVLVAGERRCMAARLEGLTQLRARVKDMTDEEAADLRFAENIHRLNLSQIEEAKRVQHDLDQLGSVEAVLEKHHKSRAWLSKILSLLTLPEQAKRLVTENIASDLEVINTVKTVEKIDPEAAKDLVDDLKATRGKENARDKAQAVKDRVKPPKKPKAEKPAKGKGEVAGPRDTGQIEPGPVQVSRGRETEAPAGNQNAPALVPADILAKAYSNIYEFGADPKLVLDTMRKEDREAVDAWLDTFYCAGQGAKDVGRAIMQGLRNGQFAADGDGAFALVAFLYGVDSETKYSLVNIFSSMKP
jgi:ParB family chromosome partitioning protein